MYQYIHIWSALWEGFTSSQTNMDKLVDFNILSKSFANSSLHIIQLFTKVCKKFEPLSKSVYTYIECIVGRSQF